jgi:hypothetical protein
MNNLLTVALEAHNPEKNGYQWPLTVCNEMPYNIGVL